MGRILVVDDDHDIRELLSICLTSAGHSVSEADNGPTALSMVAGAQYDLIVLDVNMPLMSGHEVARQLRSGDESGRPLVLMLSAKTTASDAAEGLAAGADEYATKPFHIRHLSDRIGRMLQEGHCA